MQSKDIPAAPVLEFLAKLRGVRYASCSDLQPRLADGMPTVLDAMPPGTPQKVAAAKMRKLINRGWVTGFGCGTCRGDFEITAQGLEALRSNLSA